MENYSAPEQTELQAKIQFIFNKINSILYSKDGKSEADDSVNNVSINGKPAIETLKKAVIVDLVNQRCVNITKITSYYSEGGEVAEDRIVAKVRRYSEDMYRSGEKLGTVYSYNQESNELDVFGHMRGTWGYYAEDYDSDNDVNYYLDLLQNNIDGGLVLDDEAAAYVNNLYDTKRDPWPRINDYLIKNGIVKDDSLDKSKKIAKLLKKLRK